jgi:hypothetical protein
MLARGGILQQGHQAWRQAGDIDHQRIELRAAGGGTTAAIGQPREFVEGEFVDREVAFIALDR